MSKRANGAALKAYSHFTSENVDEVTRARELFCKGYEQAEKDIIVLIESRISEILGDAQPKPALRVELQEIIKRIKEEE